MLFSQFLALSVALAPTAVSAALFPKSSQVKNIDAKGFRKAMGENVRLTLSVLYFGRLFMFADDFYRGLHCALVWCEFAFPMWLQQNSKLASNSIVKKWHQSTAKQR